MSVKFGKKAGFAGVDSEDDEAGDVGEVGQTNIHFGMIRSRRTYQTHISLGNAARLAVLVEPSIDTDLTVAIEEDHVLCTESTVVLRVTITPSRQGQLKTFFMVKSTSGGKVVGELKVVVTARVMLKEQGKPMLRNGVHLVSAPDDDDDDSDKETAWYPESD